MLMALILLSWPNTLSAETITCGTLPPFAQGQSKEEQLKYLLQRAIACVREGKPALSIEIFSEMIGIDPENDAAYLNRGNAYLQMGQIPLSIADFSWVISLKPETTEAWYNRGIAFIVAHKFDLGVADLGGMSRPLLNSAGRALPVDDAMRLSVCSQVSAWSYAWRDAQPAPL
jgi:tetratricopeptide (TPR) repeat protein